jgi:hypothetical protein
VIFLIDPAKGFQESILICTRLVHIWMPCRESFSGAHFSIKRSCFVLEIVLYDLTKLYVSWILLGHFKKSSLILVLGSIIVPQLTNS